MSGRMRNKRKPRVSRDSRELQTRELQRFRAIAPPNFNPTMTLRTKRRYLSTGSGVFVFSSVDLLLAGGCAVTVASTSSRAIFFAVKVHAVKVWSQPITSSTAAFGATTTIGLTWGPIVGNVFYGANRDQIVSTSVGPEEPVYIQTRPPKGSSAAGWMMSNTDRVFSLWTSDSSGATVNGIPAGCLVELDASYVMSDGSTLGQSFPHSSTSSLGQVVFPPLDNQNSKLLLPVLLNAAK